MPSLLSVLPSGAIFITGCRRYGAYPETGNPVGRGRHRTASATATVLQAGRRFGYDSDIAASACAGGAVRLCPSGKRSRGQLLTTDELTFLPWNSAYCQTCPRRSACVRPLAATSVAPGALERADRRDDDDDQVVCLGAFAAARVADHVVK